MLSTDAPNEVLARIARHFGAAEDIVCTGLGVASSEARVVRGRLRYWPHVDIASAPVTVSRYVAAPADSDTQK